MSEHWTQLTDGTVWPVPDASDEDRPIAWALAYGTPTREELIRAASIIHAYDHLVMRTTRERRNRVVREIRIGRPS